ncbi:MAG: RNA polymerase sigma factor [Bacteroidales bacterium]|nr:RNA polymerase sigma factor [Bacteroidales bacterium]MBN2748142.1 RNA polymerase sigma factor [Bacteroidales bacterium]
MEEKEFIKVLDRCSLGDRKAQEHLYRSFYGYAMSIALRYSCSREMAEEIVNDSFLKVFTKLESHQSDKSFKAWLRKIVINTAIDHNRRNIKTLDTIELREPLHEMPETENCFPKAEEIIALLHKLSPMYRMVFNLYIMEDYSHEEIAQQLNISVNTSRANLSRAKERIVELVKKYQAYAES